MASRILRLTGITLLAVVLVGAKAQPVHSPSQINVVDALGQRIGPIVGFVTLGSQTIVPIVGLSIHNRLALVGVDRTKFRGISPANMVYFETMDCTGAPFFNADEFPPTQVRGPGPYTHVSGNRVSFLDLGTAPHHFGVEMHSAMDSDSVFGGESSGLCAPGISPLADAYEGEFLGDLDEMFVSPFSMR